MQMYDIIRKKRDGGELTREEIHFFVDGYVKEQIPDYQASALAMAVYFRGMTDEETAVLTDEMAHSGEMLDLSLFGDLSCDKHSTGGVGDKTSLIVGPIAAALGVKLPKMSGRGLGHTGGTVDKLESIPGYKTTLDTDAFLHQVDKIGMAIVGQSGELAPADKKLYALRDVTATVDSIPLITSSIMSKKLAAGAKNIVLDVKYGSGAFMKTLENAEMLARSMVRIGTLCGRNVAALITDMASPLGMAIGNSLEVTEAADILKNNTVSDLSVVSFRIASLLVSLAFGTDPEKAQKEVEECVRSGAAFKKMKEWITAQGGDAAYLDDPSRFPRSRFAYDVVSPEEGYLDFADTQKIGSVSVLLGAGRMKKEDAIDLKAGILLCKKRGDLIQRGDVLCTLYTDKQEVLPGAAELFLSALSFSPDVLEERNRICRVIEGRALV